MRKKAGYGKTMKKAKSGTKVKKAGYGKSMKAKAGKIHHARMLANLNWILLTLNICQFPKKKYLQKRLLPKVDP